MFSALAFAELASSIPVSGSAYTYSYATLGELAAWIIGWDLILEYGVSIAGVAVGWGQYFNELLDSLLGLSLPEALASPPGEGGTVNVPAAFLVLAVTGVLMIGVRETARTNTIMVAIKLFVLLLFIVLGVTAFNSDNFSPFFVEGEGFDGTVTAASLIFFAYIGFDAVSTSGEEVKEPGRDLPRAIIGSLAIATLLYILVAVVATGALPFAELDGAEAPLAAVLSEGAGIEWGADVISFGALVAITSVVLTLLYGHLPDGRSAGHDVGALPDLDGDRPAHLLPLRDAELTAAPRRGHEPGGRPAAGVAVDPRSTSSGGAPRNGGTGSRSIAASSAAAAASPNCA
jgi:APA family basic amino acid/polyamine antiporter